MAGIENAGFTISKEQPEILFFIHHHLPYRVGRQGARVPVAMRESFETYTIEALQSPGAPHPDIALLILHSGIDLV